MINRVIRYFHRRKIERKIEIMQKVQLKPRSDGWSKMALGQLKEELKAYKAKK